MHMLRSLSRARLPLAATQQPLIRRGLLTAAHSTSSQQQAPRPAAFAAHSALRHRSSRSASTTPAAAAVVSEAAPAAQHHEGATNGANTGGNTAPTFQEAVRRLQDYWASIGCIVWLPHNTEVGAGTMNPATFLRCAVPLGLESTRGWGRGQAGWLAAS